MPDMQPQMMPQQMPAMYPQQGYYQQPVYSPYSINQQRLQQMEQMYPHLAQNNYQQQVQQQPLQSPQAAQLKGRAVTGIDEAKASQIDFDGSVHIFTDIANGNIYTKQIGLNGLAEFNIYTLQPKEVKPAIAAAAPPVQDDINALMTRISVLENKINQYEGVFLNGVQSNADNRDASKQRKPNTNNSTVGGE